MRKKHTAVCFITLCVYKELLQHILYFHSSADQSVAFSKCLKNTKHFFTLFSSALDIGGISSFILSYLNILINY